MAAALVEGDVLAGDVVVDDDGRIAELGSRPAGPHGLALPGFVDLQVNGYGGADFTRCELDGYRAAARAMVATGVTSFLATLPTTHPDRYSPALDVAAAAVHTDLGGARVVGVHLEGPFLAPTRAGAHRPDWLRRPDAALVERWAAAAPVRLLTLAPELPGALEVIARARALGIAVSIGHTDATAAEAHAAVDAGATAHTHLWNAHRPITSRDPGPGAVALIRPEVAPCLIADLVHVAAETLSLTIAAAADRYVVVTDAVALAGQPDGTYDFGGRTITLAGGSVRLDDGTLAGSAGPLDAAVRNLVGLGRPVAEVIDAVTRRPAALLGSDQLGRLVIGGPADVTVLDDHLEISEVLVAGVSQR